MTKIRFILLALACITLTNCNTTEHEFPLDKRFWDTNDYDTAVLELRYGYKEDEKLPTFADPEKRLVVEKLTDEQNFNIVLNDNELGIEHRNDVATEFFKHWQSMTRIYVAKDRKDQYLYDKELLAVWHFGLELQLKYFKLGNDQIRNMADDPNSVIVQSNIDSNVKTMINNYLIYLDLINEEDAFTEEGENDLASGIDQYFTQMIELYPDADYNSMKRKAELMINKSHSDNIKSSLNKLIQLIESKTIEQ